mmetsp:Transcript_31429/g.71132  ORF Transcript_31429/g.71132 Transcript_31429/m.71132 type:complete len:122 (+) Transcript_31429:285-650(+)
MISRYRSVGVAGAAPVNRERRRRVVFLDETSVSGTPVSRIVYRPATPVEERAKLYYNSRDYEYFRIEDVYRKIEELKLKCADVKSDFVGFGREKQEKSDEDVRAMVSSLRRIKTSNDLSTC